MEAQRVMPGASSYGSSSTGRAAVSKAAGSRFDSWGPCLVGDSRVGTGTPRKLGGGVTANPPTFLRERNPCLAGEGILEGLGSTRKGPALV